MKKLLGPLLFILLSYSNAYAQFSLAEQQALKEMVNQWLAAGSILTGGHVIEDEGTPVTPETNLNFVGAGVTAADSGGKTVVTINSGGAPAFSAITGATNTTSAMILGTGSSLTTSGSGTNTATAAPFSGLSSSTNTTGAFVLGTGASLTTSGSGTNTATAMPFSGLSSSTNSTGALVIGTGASLTASGSGTIVATSTATAGALAANGANCSAGSAPLGVDAAGAAETCTDYLEEPTTAGVVVKTAANTSVSRDITGTSGNIVITNGSPAGFAGNININTGANVPALSPTDDTIMLGDGATWTSATLPNCIDSGGQHLNYTTSTNSISCGTSGGGTISGLNANIIPVAASPTSITDSTSPQLKTNAGVLEIGSVGTNSWDLDTSAISGHKTQTVQNAADTFVYKATSDILTNKTIDAEGTGNVITIPFKRWISVAACIAGVASHVLDAPSSNAPAPTCDATDTNMGTLDFDDTTDESVEFTDRLPSDWAGAIDVVFVWKGVATTNAVGWCLQNARTPAGAVSSTSFVAQGSGNCVSSTAAGTTLQETHASKTGVTCTSCAAGDRVKWRISRDANGGAVTDSFSGDAKLIGIELTYRRAM